MIDRTVSTAIDADQCIGCGACVAVCPLGTISLRENRAAVTGDRSLSCGHCAAVCPVGAVTVAAVDPASSAFSTFAADRRWLPHGGCNTSQLVRLMASRRSCRNFRETPVERNVLEDLVRIGVTAPSGSNSQMWTFTILPFRAEVVALGEGVALFFRRINALAEKAWLRGLLRLIGKPELGEYYRDYHRSVSEALADRERGGKDRLFHGATAAIVVGSKPGASTPREDALLATQNILLGAHSMGLGTCLIGFAVVALGKAPRLRRSLGMDDDERVHAVIAIGHPDERYVRTAERKRFLRRYCEGSG